MIILAARMAIIAAYAEHRMLDATARMGVATAVAASDPSIRVDVGDVRGLRSGDGQSGSPGPALFKRLEATYAIAKVRPAWPPTRLSAGAKLTPATGVRLFCFLRSLLQIA